MNDPLNELRKHLDSQIPEEVLQDESWSPRLLPDLNNLTQIDYTLDDMEYDDE